MFVIWKKFSVRKFMNKAVILILSIAFILILTPDAAAQNGGSRIDLQIVTDEAEAVLQILEKNENAQEITVADWQKLFATEGYARLKKRELSLRRSFEDADFKAFVLSKELAARRRALAETLAAWKQTNANRAGALALDYLPSQATIRAKIYPVIKPRDNSFVFEVRENPAIFLYLDPKVTREQFENTLAHELHHIGFGTACPSVETSAGSKNIPPPCRRFCAGLPRLAKVLRCSPRRAAASFTRMTSARRKRERAGIRI